MDALRFGAEPHPKMTRESLQEVLNLADCGIPAVHRFAFYDQARGARLATGCMAQAKGVGGGVGLTLDLSSLGNEGVSNLKDVFVLLVAFLYV